MIIWVSPGQVSRLAVAAAISSLAMSPYSGDLIEGDVKGCWLPGEVVTLVGGRRSAPL
ncbi:MAG TPA: hypothetical protein VFV73_34865 [Streptosporangiaceae bacterium]|nr:hypothetical protein [Streptosporangiaceae bacterium]